MTKAEKRAQEEQLPIKKRNYWHLSSGEKTEWLSARGLTKSDAVIQPMLIPFIGLAAVILAVVMLIFTIKGGDKTIFATNKAIWFAAEGVVAACGIVASIIILLKTKSQKRGWFINRQELDDKSQVQKEQEAIAADTLVEDTLDAESGNLDDDLIIE